MIELLRHPVTIPGKVPSMANIHLNWRMVNVPIERIKNPATLSARRAYDYAISWRDQAVFLLRAEAQARAPDGTAVFIHVHLAFKPAKGKDNPAALPQDVDNPAKAVLDAIQKAGIVANDKQTIFLLLEKACAAGETKATVRSIAAGRAKDKRRWLAGLQLEEL